MITQQATVVIARPVEQVFAFVADVGKRNLWCMGVLQAKQTSAHPLATGATFHETFRLFLGQKGDADYEITEFEPNKRFGFASTSGPIRAKDILTFESVVGGTRVTQRVESQFANFQFLEPLFKGMGQRGLESGLARLKGQMEETQ